uniref:Uncharacterized protein n=1 Tax=Anguilla anguilla TaxID=7936 RepID=A0A0E9XGN1_ANGAN
MDDSLTLSKSAALELKNYIFVKIKLRCSTAVGTQMQKRHNIYTGIASCQKVWGQFRLN